MLRFCDNCSTLLQSLCAASETEVISWSLWPSAPMMGIFLLQKNKTHFVAGCWKVKSQGISPKLGHLIPFLSFLTATLWKIILKSAERPVLLCLSNFPTQLLKEMIEGWLRRKHSVRGRAPRWDTSHYQAKAQEFNPTQESLIAQVAQPMRPVLPSLELFRWRTLSITWF